MVAEAGVSVRLTAGDTLTVATAEVVQEPMPFTTVYVVVTPGLTVTTAVFGGLAPLLAVQVNVLPPLAVKVVLCPAQIVVVAGLIVTVLTAPTVTVEVAEAVQLPAPVTTV